MIDLFKVWGVDETGDDSTNNIPGETVTLLINRDGKRAMLRLSLDSARSLAQDITEAVHSAEKYQRVQAERAASNK